MQILRKSFAEAVGVFALVFVGGGAIIVTGGENLLAIALAHGLILGVMITAVIHVSGGQFNPAVSIGLATIGKQRWSQAAAFIIAQLAGGLAAAGLLSLLFSGAYDVNAVSVGATLGALTNDQDIDLTNPVAACGLEAIGTFFLMFVIMGVGVDGRRSLHAPVMAGLAIGLTLTADILCFGPATGASVNPARTLGPAVIASAWNHHWVYWVGPMIGALAAAISYEFIIGTRDDAPLRQA